MGNTTDPIIAGDPCARDAEAQKAREDAEAWRKYWMEAVALEHRAVKRGNRFKDALRELLDATPHSHRLTRAYINGRRLIEEDGDA